MKELKVTPINDGIVIDHLPSNTALKIVHILNLDSHNDIVTIGTNLSSKKNERKDIIKLEAKTLSQKELNKISLLAPNATISVIENAQVKEKITIEYPKKVKNLLECANPNCITNKESCETEFRITNKIFTCLYCEKQFMLHELEFI